MENTKKLNYTPVKGSPFTIVRIDEEISLKENEVTLNKGYHLLLGNTFATTQSFKTKKEAIDFVNRKEWDLIACLIYKIQEAKK